MRGSGQDLPVTSRAMKTILAPIDLSDGAAAVTSRAGELARSLNGRVVLLHVIPPPEFINEYATESERLATEEIKEAKRQIEQWKLRLKSAGVAADASALWGPPVTVILEEAARTKADYIVMGSHGHGALYHLLLGGIVVGVIHESPCPVVVVPTHRAEYNQSESHRNVERAV